MKEIEFVAEESDLVSYRVKPNFAALGPKFGKQMPQVKAAVEGLDADHVTEGARGAAARSASRSTATTTP